MKKRITNYAFDHVLKTVTFKDFEKINLDGMLLITNLTRNIILFNFAVPEMIATVDRNVLTLSSDTSAMLDTDKLQIFYEDGEEKTAVSLLPMLRQLFTAVLYPSYLNRATNRVQSESTVTGTLTTVSTVTSITNPISGVTNLGGYPSNMLVVNQNYSAWANMVRSRIS